jgi:hypothetical protein
MANTLSTTAIDIFIVGSFKVTNVLDRKHARDQQLRGHFVA